jgi:hypothetical protein
MKVFLLPPKKKKKKQRQKKDNCSTIENLKASDVKGGL